MYYYEQAKQTDIGQISSKVDEINSKLSEQLGISSVLVKYWLHGKSNTYVKYGIKKINYIK